MAYNEEIEARILKTVSRWKNTDAKKMFGGVGFMLQGNMACGVNKDDLIVRVAPESHEELLDKPHTRTFDLTGRPMKGWILVAPGGYESDADLQNWVELGVEFALSLPAK